MTVLHPMQQILYLNIQYLKVMVESDSAISFVDVDAIIGTYMDIAHNQLTNTLTGQLSAANNAFLELL